MSPYTRREVKAATLLIAIVQMLWGVCALYSPAGPESLYMIRGASGPAWFFMQFATGATLAVGAVCPRRKVRHLGLYLSAFVWFSMFIALFTVGLITPVTVTMPVFAIACLALLIYDTRGKQREKVC